MNTPRSSDITTVINVDIVPLQHSEYALGTDGNLIQAWSSNIPEQFPIDSIDQQDKRVVILHIGHPHKNYTIQTEMKKGKLKVDVMWEAAERFACSYEYVRKCVYYYRDVNWR